MLIQKLEYIDNNPVRRGYVDELAHWRYSSYRNYSSSRYYEVQILIIKLLWCGHLARTKCTSLKATCCIWNCRVY
ncbi:hypothetical protein [Dolichospermum flos-aquae]|uniref:hypothetical protein n=1 Tax=Dolichospermum flosaquae TaxID=1166 RepID=UPI001D138D26|nr:hypothetical protein [Dolichospermum flos-aquae]